MAKMICPVTYNNIRYNHQQLWGLVRALNKDGYVVEFKCGLPDASPSYRYEACLDSAIIKEFAFGQSPFDALANCVCSLKITKNELSKVKFVPIKAKKGKRK